MASILAPFLSFTINSLGTWAACLRTTSGLVAFSMVVVKIYRQVGPLVCGTKAKFKSPSTIFNASPDGKSLNFVDTILSVPGST